MALLNLNLSTVSNRLISLEDPNWTRCNRCGNDPCTCWDFRAESTSLTIAGDDKGKAGDGNKDDPHNDVTAYLERCLDVPMDAVTIGDDEIPTVKQDVAMSLSQWMAWSRGQAWDKCPCEDYDLPNYQCPNCK